MSRASFIAAVGLILIVGPSGLGQTVEPLRVLFLGNSVFYYRGGIYRTFQDFCEAGGLRCEAVSQRNEPQDTGGIEFLNYGRIPVNLPDVAADQKIHDLIQSGGFDYVVLEGRRPGYLLPEFVTLPTSPPMGEHIPYEQNLAALGRLHRTVVESGAQTVLYMHPGPQSVGEVKHGMAQLYQRLRLDLEEMEFGGKRRQVTLVPASLLWLDAIRRYGVENWYADFAHGTPLARYASACMLYTYITGKDPRENDYRSLPRDSGTAAEGPDEYVSQADAEWIKNQVWLYYATRPRTKQR